MNAMQELGRKVAQDESGQNLIEYSVLACVISIAVIFSVKGLSANIAGQFVALGSRLNAAL